MIFTKGSFGQHDATDVPLAHSRGASRSRSSQRHISQNMSTNGNIVAVRKLHAMAAAGGHSDLEAQRLYDGCNLKKGYANGILGGTRDSYQGWGSSLRPPWSASTVARPRMGSSRIMRAEPWHGMATSSHFIDDASAARVFRRCPPTAVFELPTFTGGQFTWPTPLPPTPQAPRRACHKPQAAPVRPRTTDPLGGTKEDWVNEYAVGTLNRGLLERGKHRVRGGANYGKNVQTGQGFDG